MYTASTVNRTRTSTDCPIVIEDVIRFARCVAGQAYETNLDLEVGIRVKNTETVQVRYR